MHAETACIAQAKSPRGLYYSRVSDAAGNSYLWLEGYVILSFEIPVSLSNTLLPVTLRTSTFALARIPFSCTSIPLSSVIFTMANEMILLSPSAVLISS